ncbi:protein distal antenna [Aethina tumida]|uniref:protein distal antenna n=1 Tax=Aethina tumida TaxID=116153 RepID=UPI00096B37E6|nr:protein distal antenna [Aethina tumida]
MSAKAGKRPLRSLTAHEKLDAIRRVHDGESKASVARDIGVPESTLRGWCKNEDKISYLSRQSSPETDDSDHKDKRIKLDDSLMQPFNLSLKPQPSAYSPTSDLRQTADLDLSKSTSLSAKAETPKSTAMSERERNRAELARLSIELGLNRPEMFLPTLNNTAGNITDLSFLWNNLLIQQQKNLLNNNKKVTAAADTSTSLNNQPTGLLKTVDQDSKVSKPTLPNDKQQSVHDSVWYWLKTQQAMLGLNQAAQPTNSNGISSTSAATPVTTMANNVAPPPMTGDQSSWFWKWYKQLAYGQQMPPAAIPDKPILYQQLTKDQNAENLSVHDDKDNIKQQQAPVQSKPNKARSVLDNLLFNNNNNVALNKKDEEDDEGGVQSGISQTEAVEHGEKFLKWLESCSEPSITAMQIMQFRSLLNNVKIGADRKNGDLQHKTKVKRK